MTEQMAAGTREEVTISLAREEVSLIADSLGWARRAIEQSQDAAYSDPALRAMHQQRIDELAALKKKLTEAKRRRTT